jgi:mannose-6-phosphate isomerase-like protein (cupin superfamily)
MANRKHLVLDDDVYESLVKRRSLTGVPMGAIGNGILRSHIASRRIEQLVGEYLVSAGKVSPAEYEEALLAASENLRRASATAPLLLTQGDDGVLTTGSWSIRSLLCPPERTFQLLEAWARDSCERSTEQHTHNADEYIVLVEGRALCVLNGLPCTLQKGTVLHIPAGAIHTMLPVGRECHLLILVIPSVPEFYPSSDRGMD